MLPLVAGSIACARGIAGSTVELSNSNSPGECFKADCNAVFNINSELKLIRGGHIFVSGDEEIIEDCFIPL